jgi:hypothetical protein
MDSLQLLQTAEMFSLNIADPFRGTNSRTTSQEIHPTSQPLSETRRFTTTLTRARHWAI